MAGLIAIITDVLAVELSLGGTPEVVFTLGGLALGVTMIGVGLAFFKRVKGRR